MTEIKAPMSDEFKQFHPLKFAMWIGIASIIMMFTALTSAYLVRQGAGNWLNVKMPLQFWISSGIILLSSYTMHKAKNFHTELKQREFRIFFWLTFILGVGFITTQFYGWMALAKNGIYINGNPAGSFIYAISFVHWLHVAIALIIMLSMAIRFSIRPISVANQLKVDLLSIFWHFVDVLWIYLFIFFQIKFF